MLDATEQRIANLLRSNGATDTQIEIYLDEIFTYSDPKLYEDSDDEDILQDFEDWLETE
tara:strand:+ start:467 stop:643 length:177 start_codon:yes stop_codon:yes gene_type:complete